MTATRTDPHAADEHEAYVAQVFERAATYDRVGIAHFWPIAHWLLRLVRLIPGDVVLDAGCRTGPATFAAADVISMVADICWYQGALSLRTTIRYTTAAVGAGGSR